VYCIADWFRRCGRCAPHIFCPRTTAKISKRAGKFRIVRTDNRTSHHAVLQLLSTRTVCTVVLEHRSNEKSSSRPSPVLAVTSIHPRVRRVSLAPYTRSHALGE
jgi:hypothetical protein